MNHPLLPPFRPCHALCLALLLLPGWLLADSLYVKGKELVVGAEVDGKMSDSLFTTLVSKMCVSLGSFTGGPHVVPGSGSIPTALRGSKAVLVDFITMPGTTDNDLKTLGNTTVGSGRAVVYANRVAAWVKKNSSAVRAVDAFHAISMHELGHACGIPDDPTTISDEFFSRFPTIVGAASTWRQSDKDYIIAYFKGPSSGTGGSTPPPSNGSGSALEYQAGPLTAVTAGWETTSGTVPPSWDQTRTITNLTAFAGHRIALAAGETRWFRLRNPYGSAPGGDPLTYGPSPATWRIETQAWYGGSVDTVLTVYVPGTNGYQQVFGPTWDDISYPGNVFSRVEATLQPGQDCYIGVLHYYGSATETFELVVTPTTGPAPQSQYITVAPYVLDGDWTGDVAAGETRHLVFRIPQSGRWEFRTEPGGGSFPSDDTIVSVFTVVGSGPQQLNAGSNDDITPGNLWSAVQGDWLAGTYVIVQLTGYNAQTVRSVRLRAHFLGSSG